MSLRVKLFFLLFSIVLMHTISAQKVVVKDGLEYLAEDDMEDNLNSIEAVSFNKKENKKKVTSKTIEGLKKVIKKRKTLRFRKKRRNITKKCYKEAITNCNSKEKKGK